MTGAPQSGWPLVFGCLLCFATETTAADPSSKPVREPGDESRFAERYRVQADLDGDGVDDLLLSEPISAFGKAGGQWEVFLSRDGDFKKVGSLFADQRTISIEPDPLRIATRSADRFHCRIWVYSRGGGGSGRIGYFRVGEDAVTEFESIELQLKDEKGDFGVGIHQAVFKESPIPLRKSQSITTADGVVMWSNYEF